MRVQRKNRSIEIGVKKLSEIGKISGLMFRNRDTKNLLFEFDDDVDMPIHSCFVFFPFLALWLDSDGKILEHKIVKPFELSVSPKKKFRKLIEVPLNKKNREIVEFFVGKGKI